MHTLTGLPWWFPFVELIVGFQVLQYTVRESDNLVVCLHVIGGMLAPDFVVSANLSTSPGGGMVNLRPSRALTLREGKREREWMGGVGELGCKSVGRRRGWEEPVRGEGCMGERSAGGINYLRRAYHPPPPPPPPKKKKKSNLSMPPGYGM